MAYTPEVEAKIKALKAELKELQSMKSEKFSLINMNELKDLENLTGGYAKDFRLHISWLCRMSTCGATVQRRCHGRQTGEEIRSIKHGRDLSYDDSERVSQCASDVIEVLLKYAQQIKREGENDNTAT